MRALELYIEDINRKFIYIDRIVNQQRWVSRIYKGDEITKLKELCNRYFYLGGWYGLILKKMCINYYARTTVYQKHKTLLNY